ncbi:PTS sugar transporter subunit IIC [Hujiaoplasma nucleasis]|uniref:PTS sugar transporter subunit IIC n=1 Tax=Hujiaoplasma nucleasis TaxID=2725268 RepID=A0A7L6N428_9MOLU|nr:PTS sugar transporter subunit IIC [Hujiaoplasma nucleasis]QLY39968.1 PTS sugar transporter subunit IIC [Hujiaoplasma nucleasis]
MTKKGVLNFFITSFNGMAIGLFSTLIIGVIIGQLGFLSGKIGLDSIEVALTSLSTILKAFMGIGIGFGIAIALNLEGIKLVVSGVAGGIATGFYNDPMVAYLTTISVYFVFIYLLKKKTPIDILLVPLTGVITALIITKLIGSPVQATMTSLGDFIQYATNLQPFLMGLVIAVVMGMALTAPISSAAIAIAISIGGIAGGAAVVGCSVQMIGFAIMSRKDNNIGTVISIAIGTSMLQFKNILKKPIIWLPTIIVSAILGPISTLLFKTETTSIGAGMGTSGFVGQFGTLDAMDYSLGSYLSISILHLVLPIILIFIVDYIFRKKGLIVEGDLKL